MQTGKFLLALFILASSVFGAEPVKAQLNSYSMKFQPARYREFGNDYWMEVTSDPFFLISNGEVEFAPANVPYTHWGFFWWRHPIIGETIIFDFVLDVPADDANGNDTPDILEFSQEVVGRTTGEYSGPEDFGTFFCDWTKGADSHLGTCRISFDFGQNFPHQFEIFEYSGAWTNVVWTGTNGTVNLKLARAGVEGEFLEGPVAFSIADEKLHIKSPDELKTQGNAPFRWDDVSPSILENGNITIFAHLIDGTPTIEPEWNAEDYNEWQLLIIDPNDVDGDGTPDLLDSPFVVDPPTGPKLEIVKTTEGIRILIHGIEGLRYLLEDATALPAAEWFHPMTVTATGAITPVDLPAPASAVYWRARVL